MLVGLKAQEPEAPASTEPQANVDVWHWKDTGSAVGADHPRQSGSPRDVRRRGRSRAGAVRQIANDDMRAVTPTDDLRWAIGRVDTPYRGQIAWGGSKADMYRVNLATGRARRSSSPASRARWASRPTASGSCICRRATSIRTTWPPARRLRSTATKSFVNAEDDHDYEKPVYGVAGFTSDGKSVLLYDRYDVWTAPLAGGQPVNLTKGVGAKQEIRFRIARLEPADLGAADDDTPGIDLTKPIGLSAYGEWTKKSGYYTLAPGQPPAPLIWADKAIGAPIVASKAHRMIFTQQTFTDTRTTGSPTRASTMRARSRTAIRHC